MGEFFIHGQKIADGFISLHTNMTIDIIGCRVFWTIDVAAEPKGPDDGAGPGPGRKDLAPRCGGPSEACQIHE